MERGQREARRRRWADVVVIVVGIYVIGFPLWSPGLAAPTGIEDVVRMHGPWWTASTVAGALAIASVIVPIWSTIAARVLVVIAALVLLLSLAAFSEIGWLAWIAVILPALALLAAAPFLGRMPAPEEEGRRR